MYKTAINLLEPPCTTLSLSTQDTSALSHEDQGLTLDTSWSALHQIGEKHIISTFVDQTHIQLTRQSRKKTHIFPKLVFQY